MSHRVIRVPFAIVILVFVCSTSCLANEGIFRKIFGDDGDSAAIEKDTNIIESKDSMPDQVAEALRDRASHYQEKGNLDGALADLTAAVELKGISNDVLADSLEQRAILLDSKGDIDKAIADYSRAIDLK